MVANQIDQRLSEDTYLLYDCPEQGRVRISVAKVLDEYWDVWERCCREKGLDEDIINYGHCIADWMVAHRAWVEDENV